MASQRNVCSDSARIRLFVSHKEVKCSKIEKTWFLLVHLVVKSSKNWMKKSRSSHQEVFWKNRILKNFAKLTWKHLLWSLFLTEYRIKFIKTDSRTSGASIKILQNFVWALVNYCCLWKSWLFVRIKRSSTNRLRHAKRILSVK